MEAHALELTSKVTVTRLVSEHAGNKPKCREVKPAAAGFPTDLRGESKEARRAEPGGHWEPSTRPQGRGRCWCERNGRWARREGGCCCRRGDWAEAAPSERVPALERRMTTGLMKKRSLEWRETARYWPEADWKVFWGAAPFCTGRDRRILNQRFGRVA